MHNRYDDIRIRITEQPAWFDEYAVPRYGEFKPGAQADIYADRLVLMRIGCQGCGHEMLVCMSSSGADRLIAEANAGHPLKHELWDGVTEGSVHFGDVPNVDCCPAGPTMNCLDYKISEAWERINFEWVRKPECEVLLPDGVEQLADETQA